MELSGDRYDPALTGLCERVLVTILGDAGFWGRSLYLVGGMAPRYLVDPAMASSHAGTRDIDLAIVLAIDGLQADGYETLERNLRDGGFRQVPGDPGFRWRRPVDDHEVVVEFLCDTDAVAPGRMFRPRAHTGSGFQAFNVDGIRLVALDHRLIEIEAERLDEGGLSRIPVRVVGVTAFVVLKILAYVERHHRKDVYDIVFTLRNHPGGPAGAGDAIADSGLRDEPLVMRGLQLLRERFSDPRNDAPVDYAEAVGAGAEPGRLDQLRNEAVAVVDALFARLDSRGGRS